MLKITLILGWMHTATLIFARTGLDNVQRCILQSKTEEFGFGISKEPLRVDIGECATVYNSNSSSTTSFNDSMCTSMCTPRAFTMELHNDRDGPVSIPVIRSCSPTRHHCTPSCRRIPRINYFFPNSKYQSRVDVGYCTGGCDGEENSCKATKMISKSIIGPNGAITVDVIQECKCIYEKCYRVDYWESYWNHSSVCGNTTVKQEKLINVGRCQGNCAGVNSPGRCYPSQDNCLLFFRGGPTTCVPTHNTPDYYVDANLELQTVQTVSACGCASA